MEIASASADLPICKYDDFKHQSNPARHRGNERHYARKTKSKVVCEIAEAGAQITAQDLEQIASLPHVISVNRLGEDYTFLSNAVPLTASGSEEDENWMVKLSSFDELEYDSPFVDRPYKLTEGDFLTADSKNSAIVHADFAGKEWACSWGRDWCGDQRRQIHILDDYRIIPSR